MPLLFLALAVLGWRHDRATALVQLGVGGAFLAQLSAVHTGRPSVLLSPGAASALAGLALAAFGYRLWRDRRRAHIRSTAESLAVLAMGAVLLMALLTVPSL